MAQKAVKPLGLSKKKGIFRRELPFYLMLIPGVLFALVFSYGPMFGLVMAFQDFTPLKSFENSPWVGLQNFRDMLALPTFWSVVRNTLVISLSKIVLRLLVPLVIALLLNEVINEKFKRVAQTVFFLPYFLSWAVMGGILRSLFQYDGMVNSVLTSLGMERIMFLGSNTWFPIIVILSDVWKDMGYNMIIFLAAITNVDPALNESAALDGANRWQQIWNITLPTIRPIVVMLLVLSLGSVLSAGLDQVMLLYNPMVYESGDIIIILVILTAYPLSKSNNRFHGRTFFSWFFVFTMLFNGGMIPGYIVISKLGLINSIWALTLPGAMNVSYMILMMNFFRGIPNEIEEAAVIDGANQAQVLFRIYLPMSLPSLATIILFATVANWNVWMDGYMYMNTPDKYPLQTYLATILMESKTNVEALMTPEQLARLSQISQKTIEAAQIFLAALPIMCVYPFLQKYYIKGIVVGSVKG